jgi:hypothetical protein
MMALLHRTEYSYRRPPTIKLGLFALAPGQEKGRPITTGTRGPAEGEAVGGADPVKISVIEGRAVMGALIMLELDWLALLTSEEDPKDARLELMIELDWLALLRSMENPEDARLELLARGVEAFRVGGSSVGLGTTATVTTVV